MRRLAIALAATALVAAPGAALAQGHGHGMSGHMGGFGRPAGGLAGHGFRGDFHRGFGGCCFGPGPFAFGFFLGLAATPWWYYGYPDYWWGYDGPYGYGPPPPPGAPPPPPGAAAAPQACGNWVWQDARYTWVPTPCAAPTPQPAPGA